MHMKVEASDSHHAWVTDELNKTIKSLLSLVVSIEGKDNFVLSMYDSLNVFIYIIEGEGKDNFALFIQFILWIALAHK